jgi:hypothetical protein
MLLNLVPCNSGDIKVHPVNMPCRYRGRKSLDFADIIILIGYEIIAHGKVLSVNCKSRETS